MGFDKSTTLFERANRVIPGGVNSPVRAFQAVGGIPPFLVRGEGAVVWDADGNRFLDYVGSWGPLILGHCHPKVVEAVTRQAQLATTFGASTELEIELAELVCRLIPSIEMIRMVSSGTEATMSAIRLARGFTGCEKIIKFEGCYHGHADSFLIKAGSGALTLGLPNSPGVTTGTAKDTLIAKFNDLESVESLVSTEQTGIAAIIVEPVAGNMGVVEPAPGFLEGLRGICSRNGILLIFDEVMTGFRVGFGGAQERYRISPDLTTLGKIIGGGLPVGAFGGRRDIMEGLAPSGTVYQAGTLSGNPLAMAAGIATLRELIATNPYPALDALATSYADGTRSNLKDMNLAGQVNQVGSMYTLFFTDTEVSDFTTATRSNTEQFATYFHSMLDEGVYLAPAQFESIFLSTAHTEADIAFTLERQRTAFQRIASSRA